MEQKWDRPAACLQSIKDGTTSDMIVMQVFPVAKITMTDLDKWDMIISEAIELLERYVQRFFGYTEFNMKSAKKQMLLFVSYLSWGVQRQFEMKNWLTWLQKLITETDDIQSNYVDNMF